MKHTVIAICAIFALMIAGTALAQEHKGHEGHKHGTPAKAESATAPVHTCPYHKNVVSDKPAKCPKCGMEMVSMESYGIKYHCPMHKDEISDKPGKCTRCGMKLEEFEQREPLGARGK